MYGSNTYSEFLKKSIILPSLYNLTALVLKIKKYSHYNIKTPHIFHVKFKKLLISILKNEISYNYYI